MRVLVGVVDQEQLRARRRGRVWGDQRQGVWNVVHSRVDYDLIWIDTQVYGSILGLFIAQIIHK